jgi:hypothetical protein
MQELMYVAARIIKIALSIHLSFGKDCRSMHAYTHVYEKLTYR